MILSKFSAKDVKSTGVSHRMMSADVYYDAEEVHSKVKFLIEHFVDMLLIS